MNKYINSIVFFFKLNMRNPFYLVSLIIILSYLGVIVYSYLSSEITNPGNMLQLSSFFIQGYMLIFMFFGFHTIHIETSDVSKDLFLTIRKGFYIKIGSNISLIVIMNIMFCMFATLVIYTVYQFTGYHFSDLYKKSMLFIFMYWFLPAFISSLIGFVIGLTVHKKFSPAFIVGIWLLISPLNIYFSNQLYKLLGMEHVPGFIHLGISDPKMSYHAFSGFTFTVEDVMNKVIWVITILVIIIVILLLKRNNVKSLLIILSVTALLFSAIPFFFLDSKPNPTDFHKRNIDELNYYALNRYEKPRAEMDYTIKKYEIDLAIEKQLKASVHIQFTEHEKGKKSFSLYHGFRVTSIEDEEGNAINYKQYGDFLDVDLHMPTKEVYLQYSGTSSPYMDANQSFAYLPYYFAWIPLKTEHPSMRYMYNSNHRLPAQPNDLIQYTLKFNGSKNIVTNLKKVEEGTYIGVTNAGVSFMYGELKTKKIGGYNITYPVTWENSMITVDSYLAQIEASFSSIKDVFQLEDSQLLPQNILFIPAVGANDTLASETMWLQEKEQLIILINPYELQNEETFKYKEPFISYQMIGALLWKNNRIVHENEDVPVLFNSLAGAYINKKLGISSSTVSEAEYWTKEISQKTKNEKHKQIIEDAHVFVSNAPAEVVEEFLLKWSHILNDPNVDWGAVENLLNVYTKEG
ncbi:hypothetical protein BAMA_24485 [Bacillus manliponensis]|uniref:Uncharacterized protein n=1 Tax=Bacillus manliponensis TaxID=574376 RepID=A0A073JY00_9BACI|nr:ABC transporter permease [Bacillus manliponensis]KEK19165.1 hypothetical protein BAMA_24485 [Bacillus manliponensis]